MRPLIRIGALGALAFFVMGTYALARPACESLFLAEHGSDALPKVWIFVAVTAIVVVSIYGHYAGRVGLPALFTASCAISAATLVLLAVARSRHVPGATFALYVWKDVYIVVLVEIFWSVANTIFAIKTARWIYGLFCAMGSLGGIVGGLLVGSFAQRYGTEAALWLVVPVLVALAVVGLRLGRLGGLERPAKEPGAGHAGGFAALTKSSYLILLAVLIVSVQVAITLIDFRYNQVLEASYPATDARTAVIGKVYAAIDSGSLILQLATGPILRVAGVSGALVSIPLILGSATLSFIVAPRFATLAVTKVLSKCLDYSVFRAAKEILYIPLSYAEKTQGKAFIDMLTYRVAKGGASVILIGLAVWGSTKAVEGLTLAVIVLWVGLTVAIVRRYRAKARDSA